MERLLAVGGLATCPTGACQTLPRTVADVLAEHVSFEAECIDRMYLSVYVPQLQYATGLVSYIHRQLGMPVASTAALDQPALRRSATPPADGCWPSSDSATTPSLDVPGDEAVQRGGAAKSPAPPWPHSGHTNHHGHRTHLRWSKQSASVRHHAV